MKLTKISRSLGILLLNTYKIRLKSLLEPVKYLGVLLEKLGISNSLRVSYRNF